jgi:hypothetical protein
MQMKRVRIGPVALGNAVANIFNPGTTTGGVGMPTGSGNLYALIDTIRIINRTGTADVAELYIGATGGSAAGTEILKGKSVPANDYIEIPFDDLRMDVADFLTGKAGNASSLVIEIEAALGIA